MRTVCELSYGSFWELDDDGKDKKVVKIDMEKVRERQRGNERDR
jgi:hypothetical protein